MRSQQSVNTSNSKNQKDSQIVDIQFRNQNHFFIKDIRNMMKNRAAYAQIKAYEDSQNKELQQQIQTFDSSDLNSKNLCKVKIVKTTCLRIEDKPFPHLVKQICTISFPNLHYLNLRNSNISNVEALEFLQCPKLQTLEMYGNKITNFNPITRSCNIKKLKALTFYMNPLNTPWRIERQNMYELSEFELDDTPDTPCTIEDLSFLFKNPSKKISKIYANSKNRIPQPKLHEMRQQMNGISLINLHIEIE